MPFTRIAIQAAIKQLLIDDLQAHAALIETADANTPLLGRGIGLDSVEALRLALGLENTFDISIPDADLNADLFATLGTLTGYVFQKTNARQNIQ
jgi:acyl carrier protein